jgi:Mg2+ and Co2+ transporter CorA
MLFGSLVAFRNNKPQSHKRTTTTDYHHLASCCNSHFWSKRWSIIMALDDVETGGAGGDIVDGIRRRSKLLMRLKQWGKPEASLVVTSSVVAPSKDISFVAQAILSDGTLKDCDFEEVMKNAHSEGKNYWIDVELPDESFDLSHLQEPLWSRLELSKFLQRHLRQPSQMQTPQVLVLQQAALLVLRVLPADESSLEYRHAAAVCLKGIVITVSHSRKSKKPLGAAPSIGRLHQLARMDTLRMMEDRELPGETTTAALAAWLHVHLERVQQACNKLRDRIMRLSQSIDKDNQSLSLGEIVDLKDTLLLLTSIAEEQNEAMRRMADGDDVTSTIDFDTTLLHAYLKVLLATAGGTERATQRLESRLATLRASYDATQQDAINKRLALLTILSAIFLPLTLMAGIWGMNFTNMPELQRENAYFYALGSMGAVAVILIMVFWRLGWFR